MYDIIEMRSAPNHTKQFYFWGCREMRGKIKKMLFFNHFEEVAQ
jgi:hypothetical protein